MSGLIESATQILSASERRLEIVSNNVANAATPGFKRQVSFSETMVEREVASARDALGSRPDLTPGKLDSTGNPLDIALRGAGFFQLRAGGDLVYSRQGQFSRAADGSVVTPQGHVLQQAGGGDLVIDRAEVRILEDGTVVDEGRPVARIAVFNAADPLRIAPLGGSLYSIPDVSLEETADAGLRQGMIEASNVTLGEEMVEMMASVRQAESGARLVQLYDDLTGRAIAAFGQGGR
jgi:flagellar basal-body rod protein FlgF